MENGSIHPVKTLRDALLALERRLTQEAASGAMQGAVDELREATPSLQSSALALVDQLTALLEQIRTANILQTELATKQGGRAYRVSRGLVRGASVGLRETGPQVRVELEQLSSSVGRGLVKGMQEALSKPAVKIASAFAGGVTLTAALALFRTFSRRKRWA